MYSLFDFLGNFNYYTGWIMVIVAISAWFWATRWLGREAKAEQKRNGVKY